MALSKHPSGLRKGDLGYLFGNIIMVIDKCIGNILLFSDLSLVSWKIAKCMLLDV